MLNSSPSLYPPKIGEVKTVLQYKSEERAGMGILKPADVYILAPQIEFDDLPNNNGWLPRKPHREQLLQTAASSGL